MIVVADPGADLQADETGRRQSILDLRAPDAVEIGYDRVADGLNPQMIPVVGLEDFFALPREFVRVAAQWAGIKPHAPLLVIDAGRPPALIEKRGRPPAMNRAGINQHQVPIHPALGNGIIHSAPVQLDRSRGILTANMDAREQLMVNLEIEFENEIIVVFFGAQHAVRVAFRYGLADDTAVFHEESG